MKAVIRLDVPDFQIGQQVDVYFKNTMHDKSICESDPTEPVEYDTEGSRYSWFFVCGECHGNIDFKDSYCRHCGQKVKWDV